MHIEFIKFVSDTHQYLITQARKSLETPACLCIIVRSITINETHLFEAF